MELGADTTRSSTETRFQHSPLHSSLVVRNAEVFDSPKLHPATGKSSLILILQGNRGKEFGDDTARNSIQSIQAHTIWVSLKVRNLSSQSPVSWFTTRVYHIQHPKLLVNKKSGKTYQKYRRICLHGPWLLNIRQVHTCRVGSRPKTIKNNMTQTKWAADAFRSHVSPSVHALWAVDWNKCAAGEQYIYFSSEDGTR